MAKGENRLALLIVISLFIGLFQLISHLLIQSMYQRLREGGEE